MTDIRPLRDRVLGQMIDPPGTERTTQGGLIITENESSEDFVRPRWFLVTHVGPEQTDIFPGQYVLVAHGRWSRGIDIAGTRRQQDKLYLIDHAEVLGIRPDHPFEILE